MAKVYNIKDLYLLKSHAGEQGYKVSEYIAKGNKHGLTLDQLIKSAYDKKSIDSLIKKQKVKGFLVKNSRYVASVAALYLLHFGLMFGVANYSLSSDFKNRQQRIQTINS